MPLADLDEQERDVVRQCLRAAVEGPFFPEWEFHTIFGLERSEVNGVLLSWPELDEGDEKVVRAINNSFNNLLGYPARNKQDIWPDYHISELHRACEDFRQVETQNATRRLQGPRPL